MRPLGLLALAVLGFSTIPGPAMSAEEVTNPAILSNLAESVERGGFGCRRIVVAHRLNNDEHSRIQFMVACSGAAAGVFYRVTFPPRGRAIVKPW